jgi:hypothetical protein
MIPAAALPLVANAKLEFRNGWRSFYGVDGGKEIVHHDSVDDG